MSSHCNTQLPPTYSPYWWGNSRRPQEKHKHPYQETQTRPPLAPVLLVYHPLSFICIHLFLHPLTPKRQEMLLNDVEIIIKNWLDLIAESLRKQITDLLHFRGSLSRMNILMHKCKGILTDWTQPRILLTFLSLFFPLRWFAPEGNRDWDLSGNLGGFVSGTRHFGVPYLMCLICYGNFEFFPRVTVNSGSADWMRLRRYTEFSLCCAIS